MVRREGDGLTRNRSGARELVPVLFLIAATAGGLLAPVTPGMTTERVRVRLDPGPTGRATSELLSAGDAVMVGAVPPVGSRIEVRARRDSGWSDWQPLVADPDHGPDPGPGTASGPASRPVWLGRVEALQVRGHGTSAVDLNLVSIPDGLLEDPLDVLPELIGEKEDQQPRARPRFPQPTIHRRSAWGPRRAMPHYEPPPPAYANGVRHVVIHHTASVWRGSRCSEADDMIRSFYRYHVEFNGWDDIGYNFLVDPCGKIWEGRAGGIRRPVVGAHAGGWNRGSTGVALIGDYDGTDGVTRAGIRAVDALVAWKTHLHGIDPTGRTTETSGGGSARTPEGRRATFPTIHSHRRTNHTSCPGDRLDHWVVGGDGRRSMAQRVRGRHRAHGVG